MRLSGRHRIGLFVTGMAVECSLSLESSIRQTVGIAIIGLAFLWLIGSITPRDVGVAVAILICAVGLYVGVAPVWSDWNAMKKSAVAYHVAIAGLQVALKSADCPTEGCIVAAPASIQNWLRPDQGNWASGEEQISFPATMSKAEIMQAFEENILLPRPTFHLGSSLRAHAWQMLGGLALFTSGLWILGWSLRRIRIGIEQQGSSCIAS